MTAPARRRLRRAATPHLVFAVILAAGCALLTAPVVTVAALAVALPVATVVTVNNRAARRFNAEREAWAAEMAPQWAAMVADERDANGVRLSDRRQRGAA